MDSLPVKDLTSDDIPIQLIFDFPKFQKCIFENFVVCPGNELAYRAALSFCHNSNYNLLFFYGQHGLGKTHILKAIGNYFTESFNDLQILYISTNDILRLYKNSTSYEEILTISRRYKSIDLLLLDDIDAVENDMVIQDQVFHIYNELMDRGKKVVVAGRISPKEMKSVQKHLQSRLLSGLVIKIGSLTDETRKDILRKLAKDEGVDLSKIVVNYILTHLSRDITDFQTFFSAVNKYSLTAKKKITVPLVKEVMEKKLGCEISNLKLL